MNTCSTASVIVCNYSNSIGICYIGGLDVKGNPKNTRTDVQKVGLIALVKELKEKYPNATVHGHNEFAAKACPCFGLYQFYRNINSFSLASDKE